MRWRVSWCGERRSVGASALGLIFCIALAIAPNRLPAADLTVVMDQAKLIKLPDKAATIVIGNPMIADASVQPGGIMIITGKGYGSTNIVALDRTGAVLMENTIEVRGPRAHALVMYRGVERETYNCTPVCERRIIIGDTGVYFDALVAQAAGRNGLASGTSAPTSK